MQAFRDAEDISANFFKNDPKYPAKFGAERGKVSCNGATGTRISHSYVQSARDAPRHF